MTGWIQTFRFEQHRRLPHSQVPRSRLVGTAPPFRRTEARAKRTLDGPPKKQGSPQECGVASPPTLLRSTRPSAGLQGQRPWCFDSWHTEFLSYDAGFYMPDSFPFIVS